MGYWRPALALALLLGLGSARVGQAQTEPEPLTPPATATPSAKVDELGELINAARVRAERLPLARAPELDAAAQTHSLDMRDHDYLDHEAPDGSQPQDRAAAAGYHVPPASGWIVVEVISAISADPAGPLDWWLNQDPAVHGKVLLDTRWREMGVGYAAGGEYGNYWTVLVGCRPGVLPSVVFAGVTYRHTEQCDPAGAAEAAGSTPSEPAASAPAAPAASPDQADHPPSPEPADQARAPAPGEQPAPQPPLRNGGKLRRHLVPY